MTQALPGTFGATPSFPPLSPLLTPNGVAMPAPTSSNTWRTPSPGGSAWVTPSMRPNAEFTLHDPNFYRDDDWRFGHDAGGTYHLERSQRGKVVRRSSGTLQSNPTLVAGVRRLEQQAAVSVATGGSGVQPGDFRGYFSHRSSNYYDASEFVAVDDRGTNRRAWILKGTAAAQDLTAGVRALDERAGRTVEGTDGGVPSRWEMAGRVGGIVAVIGGFLGAAYLMRAPR